MSKVKTFICTIPYQPKGETPEKDGLKPLRYEARGNAKLVYGETRFPIVPVINGYAEKGDRVRVLAILTEGDNFSYNYETYFVPEIAALAEKNGYAFEGIEIISSPDSEDIDTQLVLFADIISRIGYNEEIHTCITYGTKPTPIVQFMALNYINELKKETPTDTPIKCVAYGRFLHNDYEGQGVGRIWDQTALFYMNATVNALAKNRAADPEKAIRIMLGLEAVEDSEDD